MPSQRSYEDGYRIRMGSPNVHRHLPPRREANWGAKPADDAQGFVVTPRQTYVACVVGDDESVPWHESKSLTSRTKVHHGAHPGPSALFFLPAELGVVGHARVAYHRPSVQVANVDDTS